MHLAGGDFIIRNMIQGRRKTILIILIIFLIAIVFLWQSVNKTTLYVNNSFHKTYCFYLDKEFITVIPQNSVVELRLKSRKNAMIAVSERLNEIPIEEFTVNVGGKSFRYNISDFSDSTNGKNKNKAVLTIGGKVLEKPVQRITLDTLHRIMMNKLPRKMDTLQRFSQADGIKMAGDIGDLSSMKWIDAILKMPEHRSVWDEALRSTGKIGGNNAVPVLKTYLKHADMDIAFAAVDGLGNMKSSAAQMALIDEYRAAESAKLRRVILTKLGQSPMSFDIKVFVLRELEKPEPENLELLLDIAARKHIKESVPLLKKIKAGKNKLSREIISRINQSIKEIESYK